MRWFILTVFLAGCGGATGLPLLVDGGADALPCWQQPCNPDDAGRCERCPIEGD